MIDLDKARQIASGAPDDCVITVSSSWLRQAIHEISMGRSAQAVRVNSAASLDFVPAGLSVPAGAMIHIGVDTVAATR